MTLPILDPDDPVIDLQAQTGNQRRLDIPSDPTGGEFSARADEYLFDLTLGTLSHFGLFYTQDLAEKRTDLRADHGALRVKTRVSRS
jgi:hypothetical protein